MRKNILAIFMALILPCLFLSGCKEEENPPVSQITMLDIMEELEENGDITIGEDTFVYIGNTLNRAEDTLTWQGYFERQNVDTREFMSMEKVRYTYNGMSYHVRMFKFATIDSASNCYNNYEINDSYKMKQYGNIVIIVDIKVADTVLDVIDNI